MPCCLSMQVGCSTWYNDNVSPATSSCKRFFIEAASGFDEQVVSSMKTGSIKFIDNVDRGCFVHA